MLYDRKEQKQKCTCCTTGRNRNKSVHVVRLEEQKQKCTCCTTERTETKLYSVVQLVETETKVYSVVRLVETETKVYMLYDWKNRNKSVHVVRLLEQKQKCTCCTTGKIETKVAVLFSY